MATTIPSSANLLRKLRSLMQTSTSGCLHAYIVPSGDAHQSEYLADCDMRRQFISKFTGSAGTAVITLDKAALWTDGRYHLQAANQLDPESWVLMKDGTPDTPSISEWLKNSLQSGSQVGVDPYLMSHDSWKRLSGELRSSSISLVGVRQNLIDLVWSDPAIIEFGEKLRPNLPANEINNLEKEFHGSEWFVKVAELRKELVKKKTDSLVVTALDDIAWLLNLRGTDVDFNPVFFAYAVVSHTEVCLFVDSRKLTNDAKKSINARECSIDTLSSVSSSEKSDDEQHVLVFPYSEIDTYIKKRLLANNKSRIWISPRSSEALFSLVPKQQRHVAPSPITNAKAIKNETEIEGMRRCHIRDGAALCEYLCWLDKMIEENPNGHEQLWEIEGADYLENCRKSKDLFKGLSFPSISSSGPNGAIIHYTPEVATRRPISKKELYLIDSGAQYLDGTTDVTRTVHFGEPTELERDCFTRVLKGHIQLARAVFPKLVKGSALDTFARQFLWSQGLEYMHGTGHGVGMYLNVHEGPSSISSRPSPDDPGLKAGLILSNEPGYYEDGKFGIRIESLVVSREAKTKFNYKNLGFLEFETITLVPIQLKMIDVNLLTDDEIKWLNEYHRLCYDRVGSYLERSGKHEVKAWLAKETRELTR